MSAAINEYTIHIAIGFITSLGFGFGLLMTYDQFRRALKENSRLRDC